jgi:parvulin-like peptidyl-prolyl isomerase
MKEIERYWEQALLKLLIQKKSEELAEKTTVSAEEIKKELARQKRRIFGQVVILDNMEAAQKLSLSGENFDAIREKVKGTIVTDDPPQWMEPGNLPSNLEDILYSLKQGEISRAVRAESHWAVIRNVKEESIEAGSLESRDADIRALLMQTKIENALDAWIDGMRNKAAIRINDEVLKEINIP